MKDWKVVVFVVLVASYLFTALCEYGMIVQLRFELAQLRDENKRLSEWMQLVTISEDEAVRIGRDFLDGIDYMTGTVLRTRLEEENPNFYWHDLAKLEKPDIQGPRLCWLVTFGQGLKLGYFFEVWIDADTGEAVGGAQGKLMKL